MIFEETGICLYSKYYKGLNLADNDELTSGFLAVLFGYMDSRFGSLKYMRTADKTFFISKIQGIYVTLMISHIQYHYNENDYEKYSILNKRVENTCKVLLSLIERKVGILIMQLQLRRENSINYKLLFADLEPDLDSIIQQGMEKIGIIQKLYEDPTICNALEI